jgi:NedA-like, galactose-binding domain/F5/8 type C domain/PKD domain
MAGNPLMGSADLNARRIVAHGFRNPNRFTTRPGTSEVWVGDVGAATWEEIDRIISPTAGITNGGWPCYEALKPTGFDSVNLALCESLYASGGNAGPYFSWNHANTVVAGDACPSGGSSITGLAFYPNSANAYPAAHRGALFFADYTRQCVWAMKPTTPGGLPDPANIETFVANAASPTDLAIGPGDELYYVDLGGTQRRIRYFSGNQPPTAVISAVPTGGAVPLTVEFTGTGSYDPDAADEGRLTYAWDFTSDGTVDSTKPNVTFTYAKVGHYTATLTVEDTMHARHSATVLITPGDNAPTAVIDTPAAAWRVGETVSFSGHATDIQDGTLPASQLTWHLRLQHCYTPTRCHAHNLQDWSGVASGSFVAPDHELPSYLELELVAQDSAGLSHSVVRRLDPRTVDVTFVSSPPGLSLTVGDFTGSAPFTRTLIQGSAATVSAGTPQLVGMTGYSFASWSDGGAQTHVVTAPTTAASYTATYNANQLTNLALGRTAISSEPCADTETAAKAFNGTWTGGGADKWCSKVGPRWLKVDLGAVANISGFVLHHAGAGGEMTAWNTRDFTIEVSSDGASWSRQVAVIDNTASVTTHPVSVQGRYVRLNVTTPTSNGDTASRIYEFEVLGTPGGPPPPPATNLALNKPATGGTPCADTETAARAFNGSWTGGRSDKWCSKVGPRWLQVDLGATATISSFVLHHAGASGEMTAWNTRDFSIQVSNDGSTWSTPVTVTGNTASVTTHPVSVQGRYVRLNVTTPTSNGDTAARIYEFEVLGTMT